MLHVDLFEAVLFNLLHNISVCRDGKCGSLDHSCSDYSDNSGLRFTLVDDLLHLSIKWSTVKGLTAGLPTTVPIMDIISASEFDFLAEPISPRRRPETLSTKFRGLSNDIDTVTSSQTNGAKCVDWVLEETPSPNKNPSDMTSSTSFPYGLGGYKATISNVATIVCAQLACFCRLVRCAL